MIAGSSTNSALEIKDHCNKTVEIYEDVSSPELTNANRNRPLLCTYRFRSFRGAPRDWVLRIRFKKFKIGKILNATHCQGGYLQVSLILIANLCYSVQLYILYNAIHKYDDICKRIKQRNQNQMFLAIL